MKLKYYLRGLGIGIVVTVFIMMTALGNKQPMTDEEVKARAKELGMIENSVLTDIANKEEPSTESEGDVKQEIEQETEQDSGQDENQDVAQDENQDVVPDENQEVQEPDTGEPSKPENSNKDTISITVVGGDSSWTVSKRMEEAGLIQSAKDFDTYLCSYGYDKRISVGTYEIPTNATHEEMAKILTKAN